MASVTVRTGEAGAALTGEGTVLNFDANGKATITETIRADQKIEVTGLPEGAFYTIAEEAMMPPSTRPTGPHPPARWRIPARWRSAP